MQLDLLKAVDGVTYPIDGEEILPDTLFAPRVLKAERAAKVAGSYTVEDGVVTVSFDVTALLVAACDLCLDDVKLKVKTEIDAIFAKDCEDDDGTYPYTGYAVNLTPIIQQEILFRIPNRILCKSDCKGLCPVCGANKNREECGCASLVQEDGNPFAILKTIAGGANDGSTKM